MSNFKTYLRGPLPVRSLRGLKKLALQKKAVIVFDAGLCWRRPLPAAFVLCMQGTLIERLFHYGLYVYVPKYKMREAAKKIGLL